MISRLDYCNSVLAGVPLATLAPHTTPHHYYNEYSTQQHVQFSSSLEITSLQVPCNFHWLPVYAGASNISCAAPCSLYTPEHVRPILRTLCNSQPPDSHVLIYGLHQHQPISTSAAQDQVR